MTRILGWVMVIGLVAGGCASKADREYRNVADDYLRGYLQWRPQAGTALGLHEYDGKISDFSRASIEGEHARLVSFRDKLKRMDRTTMSARVSRESRTLLAAVQWELIGFEVLRQYENNPMTYPGIVSLVTYAKRDFAPKAKRLESVIAILRQAPGLFAAGRVNLGERLPRTFIETAIKQAEGTGDFVENDLVAAFDDVKDGALQREFGEVRKLAVLAMKDFADWLRKEKLPKANDNFAIGREGFAQMLRECELIDRSPEEVLEIGMKELRREQAAFARAAKQIDSSKSAREVAELMAREHPTQRSLLEDTRGHLEAIRQFVIARDLVGFPSMVPVTVEETPKFERNQSFASMDTPGALDKSTEAFYYVTPPEADWDQKKKDEWLSAFNFYGTDVVSIHEAYPGHYLQFLRLRASGVSKTQMAFGSYSFGEGWAHYCEQMVIDAGYPADADELTRAKYRLAQSQDALLRICRLCCAVKMHCQGMSVDEATTFFMENGYMPQVPARAEAQRGTWDPGYGCYTLGKLQILKLREDVRKQGGEGFSLRKFHETLLDNGQPPIRLLREMMIKDKSQWGEAF